MVFRKKKQTLPNTSVEITQTEGEETLQDIESKKFDGDIYVMPKEFYSPLEKQNKGSHLFLAIGILLVIFFAFGGAFVYVYYFQTRESVPLETSDSLTSIDDVNDSNIDDSNQPETTTTPDSIDMATTTEEINTDDISNEDDEEPIDPSTVFPFYEKLPFVFDSDRDGLTEKEEDLLGTDNTIVDSDGDSFSDGAELSAGYDPTSPQKTLIEGNIFRTYINEGTPSFSIDFPENWTLADSTETEIKILIAPNGDRIILELYSNPQPSTFSSWFADIYPNTDQSLFTTQTIGNFSALQTDTGRQMIVNLGTHILVLSYDVGNKLEVAYPSVWEYALSTLRQ